MARSRERLPEFHSSSAAWGGGLGNGGQDDFSGTAIYEAYRADTLNVLGPGSEGLGNGRKRPIPPACPWRLPS
jgi:hypothetical protein